MSERVSAPASSSGVVAAPSRWADLLPRVLSGLVMVALALTTAYVGGVVFVLFWTLAAAAIVWEWQHLVAGPSLVRRVTIGVVALGGAAPLLQPGTLRWALAVLAVGVVGSAAVGPPGRRLASAFGLVYAAALLVSVGLLRASSLDGPGAILWLFAVVWGTDVMAYFGGRLIGGPKLWPRMSPSKTWSGFLIGVGSGALAGLAVAPGSASWGLFVVGLVAGVLAQGGDLFESGVKRRYGVKDASRLIPGHGGVMDRLDGFIVAAVFACCLGVARAGVAAAGLGLFEW